MTAILARWRSASRVTRVGVIGWTLFVAWVIADGIARLF